MTEDLEQRILDTLKKWQDPEEVRVRAGEIDGEEMRTVMAVVGGLSREIAAEIEQDRDRVLAAQAEPTSSPCRLT